jgi:hypothetical protein
VGSEESTGLVEEGPVLVLDGVSKRRVRRREEGGRGRRRRE